MNEPDTRPGDYYVSAVDDRRAALLAGPFRNNHARALALVEEARRVAGELDPWSHFYAFGTCRLPCASSNPAGTLNERLAVWQHANYSIEETGPECIVLRDEGPWDRFPTITNDAEWVVEQLAPQLRGRRLFYFDSAGELGELLIEAGRFAGFAPAEATP